MNYNVFCCFSYIHSLKTVNLTANIIAEIYCMVLFTAKNDEITVEKTVARTLVFRQDQF